jgi:RNA polymerase primary sigma factor
MGAKPLVIYNRYTDRSSQVLEIYLAEINRIPLLTKEQEEELVHRIHAGDQLAFERLVNANLRFVVSVAKQFENRGLRLGDLINEGNLGLINAVPRYELRGNKFYSYAVWWIRRYIENAIDDYGQIVQTPFKPSAKVMQFYGKLEQQFEREPTFAELLEASELDERIVRLALKRRLRPISLDAPLDVEENKETKYNYYPQHLEPTPDQSLESESIEKKINGYLNSVDEKKRKIIKHLYGLDGYPELTPAEIAALSGLTKERVRQIKEEVFKYLKKHYAKKLKVLL